MILQRVPAKRLTDLELDDKLFKADFELSERYDSVSKELERLALLGIGAYGFMLTSMKDTDLTAYAHAVSLHPSLPALPALGLATFAVAACCALSCAYLNSRCLKLQVDILRLLRRVNDDAGWTAEEQKINRQVLDGNRDLQRRLLFRARDLAFVATASLVTGACLTAATFIVVLLLRFQAPHLPLPHST